MSSLCLPISKARCMTFKAFQMLCINLKCKMRAQLSQQTSKNDNWKNFAKNGLFCNATQLLV
jgi:hypothetical protein